MAEVDCEYCRHWNSVHPDETPRTACGPCEFCQAPGHVGAHPRQPCSICLCAEHWAELTGPGFHFDMSHVTFVLILLIIAAIAFPAIASWF
jgi:hypothetical protein